MIEITTHSFPEDTKREILDNDNNIIHRRGPYTMENSTSVFETCIEEGSYKFVIYDSYEDGILGDGGHMIQIDDQIVKQGK